MIISTPSVFRKLFLVIPILSICFWLFAQKGCELMPDVSPTRAFAAEAPQSSKPKSRSLQRASDLLRQAADMLDKNDPLAVRLIRQAIAILKHEVVFGIDPQDYDLVSMPSAPGQDEVIVR